MLSLLWQDGGRLAQDMVVTIAHLLSISVCQAHSVDLTIIIYTHYHI